MPTPPAPSFQTDSNARAGQPYAGKIVRVDGQASKLRKLHLPDGLALCFKQDDASLSGIPTLAGEHALAFECSDDGVSWQAATCILIVNPDPRTLWRVNEPAADLPYQKPHLDGKHIQAPDFQLAAASRRGRSHEHAGSFRDDDFFINYDAASGWAVLIVADGAGSAPSSRRGAQLAAHTAGASLVEALAGADGSAIAAMIDAWDSACAAAGQRCHALFHAAAVRAIAAIEHEAGQHGAAAKDYATTLLAAVVRRHGSELFLASFWMGDGAIAAYGPRGKVRLMGAPDSGEYAGQTRFLDRNALADSGFSKRISMGKFADLSSIMLMTDGISDPRFETDNGLADPARWDALWDEITPCLAATDADQQLLAWLAFFMPGHHDDRTIAALW